MAAVTPTYGRERASEYIANIGKQADPVTEATTYLAQTLAADADVSSIQKGLIDDVAQTQDLSEHPQVETTWMENMNPSTSVKIEGLGEVVTDGQPPTVTAFTHLMGSAFQMGSPDLMNGALSSGTPAVSSITEATAGAHQPTAVNGKTPIALVLIERSDGGHSWVPCTYATDTLTPLMQPESVGSVGFLIPGCINMAWVDKWSGALPYPISIQYLGNNPTMSRGIYGVASDLSIDAFGPSDIPVAQFSHTGLMGKIGLTDSKPTDPNDQAVTWLGSRIKIAPFGSTTAYEICSSFSLALSGGYEAQQCGGAKFTFSASGTFILI